MYDLGRKKLLRKCENKQMPSMVVSLTVAGDRVFAGDQMESCHCFKYRRAENQLVEFADDQVRRTPVIHTSLRSCVLSTSIDLLGVAIHRRCSCALRNREYHACF